MELQLIILKDNTDDDNYDEYLNQYHIRDLVKKYSDYVHYPINMDMTVSKKKMIVMNTKMLLKIKH